MDNSIHRYSSCSISSLSSTDDPSASTNNNLIAVCQPVSTDSDEFGRF